MKKRLYAFLRSFLITAFVLVFILAGMTLAAKADDNSRAIAFGDETPSVSFNEDEIYGEINFFEMSIKFEREKVEKTVEIIKDTALCAVPPVFRFLYFSKEYFTK